MKDEVVTMPNNTLKKSGSSKSKSKNQKLKVSKSKMTKRRYLCISISAICIVLVCVLVAVLYKLLTKHSCNLFHESYARSWRVAIFLVIDEYDLGSLAMCGSLRVLHFVGPEWKNLTVPSNTFQNLHTVVFHSQNRIDARPVDSNDLTSLETVTIQKGAFLHVSSFEMNSIATLTSIHLEGENLVDLTEFTLSRIVVHSP